jgi:pSer/pThr/pTyr-binding forkhead associated (FHA) protein
MGAAEKTIRRVNNHKTHGIGGSIMPKTLPQPATLLVKLHGQDSRHIELTNETLTIGRKADNTLAIEDPAVSGHHARIVKVQAVFFLEDLMSTNGTAINGRPITRHQLHDADVITIGRHRLVFQENAAVSTASPTPFVDLDRTMVLRGTDPTPDRPTPTAKVLIIAGKTEKTEYPLTKQMNVIGSQNGSAIRLTSWFAPKSAATIARRGNSYSISPSQGAKSLHVNGTEVVGQQDLKDGDQIEVAGVTLTFCAFSGTKNPSR